MNQGISILQGPHHVAQKLSSTTLPLKSESRRGAPFASLRLRSGAAFRSSATLSSLRAWLGAEEQPTNSKVASAMVANGPPMVDEDTLKTPSLGLFARRTSRVTTPAPRSGRTLFGIRGELHG